MLPEELSTAITALATVIKEKTGIVASATYKGSIVIDDRYLFLNTGTAEAKIYTPVKTQITELAGTIETETSEHKYLYDEGSKRTTINGKSRSLTISADEFVGEIGLDYIMSKKFAIGDEAKTDYAIWNRRTGKLEIADCTLNVTDDIGGEPGENNVLSATIMSSGLINTKEEFIPTLT